VSAREPRSATPAASGSSAAEMKTLGRAQDRSEVLQRVHTVRADRAARWGRMSAHQMICHLSDAFCMATGEMKTSPATGLLERTAIKWIALYAPMRWPPGIRTRPEIDAHVAGTKPGEFAADVARLEAVLALVTAEPRTFEWAVHPIFGRMSDRQWLRWGYLHMDHHLRQFGV
jgi:hypothetical protein